jgi:hypothetical protein
VNYFEAARLAHPIGLLLAGAVLADIAEGSHSSSLSRRTLRSIATWLALVLLFSFFALSLVAHRSSPEAPLWIGLQFLLGISLIAAVADHDPRRTRIVAGTALALWIVLLSHMVITLFNTRRRSLACFWVLLACSSWLSSSSRGCPPSTLPNGLSEPLSSFYF